MKPSETLPGTLTVRHRQVFCQVFLPQKPNENALPDDPDDPDGILINIM
jgi:hypothetical protein